MDGRRVTMHVDMKCNGHLFQLYFTTHYANLVL
jgi:hypothetical protein